MAKRHEMTIKELDTGCDVTTSEHWLVIVPRARDGYVLEVEDLHFHHDSAVLLPDYEASDPGTDHEDRITGLAVLRACYLHAKENPSQKVLIAGHTDTTGAADYNLTLSQMRADNILYALLGDREKWVHSAQQKHKVEDYQQILKWVANVWGWDCDPGRVDNQLGSRTRAATKEFQKSYNQSFSASIAEDGNVGPETWGAFFDVYMRVLMGILETDASGLEALRRGLHFLDDGHKTVGCGENFPIEKPRQANYRSRINRRVEILFFDPGQEPDMSCHPRRGACVPGKCELYNGKIYRFKHIPCPPATVYVLRVIDELGNPLVNRPVVCTWSDGSTAQMVTDANGMILGFQKKIKEIRIDDIHSLT